MEPKSQTPGASVVTEEKLFGLSTDKATRRKLLVSIFAECYRFKKDASDACTTINTINCHLANREAIQSRSGRHHSNADVLIPHLEKWKIDCRKDLDRVLSRYGKRQLALYYFMDDVEYEAEKHGRTVVEQMALGPPTESAQPPTWPESIRIRDCTPLQVSCPSHSAPDLAATSTILSYSAGIDKTPAKKRVQSMGN